MDRKNRNKIAMLRAGYGAGEIDVQFRKNAEEYSRRGEAFGVYWHSYACTPDMARQEAEYCAETIEEYTVSGPVRFDFGEDSARYVSSRGVKVTEEFKRALAEVFCARMKELGYDAAAGWAN